MSNPTLRRAALRALSLPLLAAAAFGQGLRVEPAPAAPADGKRPVTVGEQRPPQAPADPRRLVDPGQGDVEVLVQAMKVLDERGYGHEAARLRQVIEELQAAQRGKHFEARARKLLAGDIEDRAVRVAILELAAQGYAAAGWETNAEALGWFAKVGRSQLEGGTGTMPEMPASVRTEVASIMDRMIELVLGAAGVHHSRGNELSAQCCMRLGRFYVKRELGGVQAQPAPEPPPRPALPPVRRKGADGAEEGVRLRGLGYLGGEAPAAAPRVITVDEVEEVAEEPAPPVPSTEEEPPVERPAAAARPVPAAQTGRAPSAAEERRLLEAQLAELRQRIAELEARLAEQRAAGGGRGR